MLDLLARPDLRLLTLTGPGGAGKTRLALAVSARLLDQFEDGVYFVDLSALRDPALVPSSIARALGVHEAADEPLVERVQRHLGRRSVLLVLDNFEQLLPAAPTVAALLHACPRLKALVTSRAALHLTGEHELPVPPLAFPDPRQLPDLDVLTQYEAVALFLQRAQAVRPDFQLTAANAATIAELCARLDGLPLAIELAAARVKLLSPQALLARLGNRLALLTGGARDRPPRHQTLRGTIDWSYELLDPAAQRLFTQLAVFAGGATLDAIEAVCAPTDGVSPVDRRAPAVSEVAPTMLDLVGSLVDESLLRQVEIGAGDPRFDMLETIREYAAERLEASGEAERLRARHADYYLALARQATPELLGPQQAAWLERLEREHDNLRAVLSGALAQGAAELGLQLAGALGRFWEVRGHFREGEGWLEQVLARWPMAPDRARAEALNAAGSLAHFSGQCERAMPLHEEALRLRRALGDRQSIAVSLHNLGATVLQLGELERAEAHYTESLAILRELGDQRGIALSLNDWGVLARNRGDHARAAALYGESLALFRALGDTWGVGLVSNNLARVMRDQGTWDQTAALCAESLRCFLELGDRRGVSWVLSNLVVLAQRRQDWELAAHLHGAAEALRDVLGPGTFAASPAERAAYAAAVAAIRAELGEQRFASAVASGRATPPEQIAAAVLSDAAPNVAAPQQDAPPPRSPTRPSRAAPSGPLTRRETEVAVLAARGLTNRQIAGELVISEGTVGVHLEHIYSKLGIRSRAQLAVWVVERGL